VADLKKQGQSHSQLERTEVTAGAPYVRVIRGDASPEEIVALVATLAAVAAARSAAATPDRPQPAAHNWNSRARLLRAPMNPAAGGWRRSALP
jgi:hypothetical protein